VFKVDAGLVESSNVSLADEEWTIEVEDVSIDSLDAVFLLLA